MPSLAYNREDMPPLVYAEVKKIVSLVFLKDIVFKMELPPIIPRLLPYSLLCPPSEGFVRNRRGSI